MKTLNVKLDGEPYILTLHHDELLDCDCVRLRKHQDLPPHIKKHLGKLIAMGDTNYEAIQCFKLECKLHNINIELVTFL